MVNKANILALFIILVLNSCASMYTSKEHYAQIDQHLNSGDSQLALEELQSSRDDNYKEKDKVLFYLEEGMLYRYAGFYEKRW